MGKEGNIRPVSIEIPVLFDLMDRMQGTRLLGTLDHLRVSLEWAVQNDLFQDRVAQESRIVVLGADWGRDDQSAVQVVTGVDDRQDRAGDGGDTGAAPEPPQGCAFSCGEGAEAPASASAGDAGGGDEPPPASVKQNTPAATCPFPAAGEDGAAEDHAAVPEPGAVRPAPGSRQVTGPLSADEKQAIHDLASQGKTSAEIAVALNRRTQTVALFRAQDGKAKNPEMSEARAAAAPKEGKPPVAAPADTGGPVAVDKILIAEGPEAAAAIGGVMMPPASPTTDAPRPPWRREIEACLNALGHKAPWTPALDLALAEGLMLGTPLPVLADDLGVEVGQAKARFIAMTSNAVDRYGRRHLTIELQKRLIDVLRDRARAV